MSFVGSEQFRADPPPPPRTGLHQGRRDDAPPILVVDDDESILETVRAILEAEGHAVVTAADGRQALDALRRVTPKLMLLDMRMPVLDGWGVAAALREHGRAFPILVMTAAENARRWADEIEADGSIAKPFELAALLDAVERHTRGQGPLN